MAKNREKRSVGRPRVLTDAKKKAVIAYISAGGSTRMAAKHVGCSAQTITAEADRDPKFMSSLTRADAACYLQNLKHISGAAKDDWRAAAWLLERKWAQDFGKDRDLSAEAEPTQIRKILVETRQEAKEYVRMSSLMPGANDQK